MKNEATKWIALAISLMVVGSSFGKETDRAVTNEVVRIVEATNVKKGSDWKVLVRAKDGKNGSERIGVWGSFDVAVDVEADWVPKIEVKYFVIMESEGEEEGKRFTVAEARLGYRDLEKGENVVGVVVSPEDMKKYGKPIWFLARVFAEDGREVGMVQTADEEKLREMGERKWWKEVKFAADGTLKDWTWLPQASIVKMADEALMKDDLVDEED